MALKLTILCLCVCGVYNLKLEKALIFSRHNIREPVTDNNLKEIVDIWPASTYTGQLTPKGANLEKHMGEYIGNWLKTKKLVPNCPSDDSVYIYANTLQRTTETAKAFVDGAFPNCDVKVHSIDPDQMDPVFNTSYRNTPPQTKNLVAEEMENNLNKLDLKGAYVELDKLLDISDASICQEHRICSFANSSDKICYEIGKEPELIGPLKYGNEIVDAYLMAYYEGFAMESVGDFENLERLLGEISRASLNVFSHSPYLARLAAKVLLDYICDELLSDTKLVLMVGHDTNIQSLVDALDIEEFTLPDQVEKTPIGGIWHNHENTVALGARRGR
ncbi:glucose-1-phosphatase-like [Aricia agestis]|uniref:glucose-1-phosphatase-like n=1 Tax=Aricia agestis TaxID=91739 RepID=UPI001C209E00|nr:glucose-1-phosphatase-like [Aricia agestis]